MKVAFFIGALRTGGAESLVCDVCRKRELVPFEICCIYRKDGDYSEAYNATGVPMMKVPREGSMLKYLLSLRKTILRNHVDIVHAQTPSNAIVSFLALLFTRVRIVVTLHGFSFAKDPKYYQRWVYRICRKLICVSNYEKEFYAERWHLPRQNKLRVVYNGIEFSKLDQPVPDPECPVVPDRTSLNMVMVGSFRDGRSQSFVCKVAHALDVRDVPFNLFFVGRREEKEPRRYDDCVRYCNEHLLMDKVHFLGNRTDLPYLLKQMDLFIYASEHDTFGIAVLEALASGLPVVVNDWVVMQEITGNGKFAAIYKTDDVEDCVSKVMSLKDKKETEPVGFEASNLRIAAEVREKYSIEKHIHNLHEIYLSC